MSADQSFRKNIITSQAYWSGLESDANRMIEMIDRLSERDAAETEDLIGPSVFSVDGMIVFDEGVAVHFIDDDGGHCTSEAIAPVRVTDGPDQRLDLLALERMQMRRANLAAVLFRLPASDLKHLFGCGGRLCRLGLGDGSVYGVLGVGRLRRGAVCRVISSVPYGLFRTRAEQLFL